ncbi:leucine-rich repeat-containing G-protein coupled receptor 6-like [Arapaima gigas]
MDQSPMVHELNCPGLDLLKMRDLLVVCSLMQFSILGNGTSMLLSAKLPCPSICQCEVDSALQLVDCSDRGLTSVPTCLSSHTSIL